MTALNDKLTQLKLDFMARELDRVVADAAARSLSPAATLEWLADLELEGRQSRSVLPPTAKQAQITQEV